MAAVTLIGANAIPVFGRFEIVSGSWFVRLPLFLDCSPRLCPSCDDHGGASLRAVAAGVVTERSKGVGSRGTGTDRHSRPRSRRPPSPSAESGEGESETTEVPVAAVASAETPPPQEPNDLRHHRDDDQ